MIDLSTKTILPSFLNLVKNGEEGKIFEEIQKIPRLYETIQPGEKGYRSMENRAHSIMAERMAEMVSSVRPCCLRRER